MKHNPLAAAEKFENLVFFLTALIGLILVSCTVQWREFTSDDLKFSVMVPGAPKMIQGSAQNEISFSGMALTTFKVSPHSKEGATYRVEVYQTSPNISLYSNFEDFKNIYRNSINNIQIPHSLISEESVDVSGFDGWEFEFKEPACPFPNEKHTTVRMFVKDNRLYIIKTEWPKSEDFSPDRAKFFDSFTVLD